MEEPLQDPDEPVGPQGQAINTNMAEAGKNTVSPSKFYGDEKEDVEKWLLSFERISTANRWNEDRMAKVLPALMLDRAADFWEELPEDTQKSYNLTKAALLEHFCLQRPDECIIRTCITVSRDKRNLLLILVWPFRI